MRSRLKDYCLTRMNLSMRSIEGNGGYKYSTAHEPSVDAPEDKPIGRQAHANEHHYLPGH